MPRILRLSLRNFCSSSVSNEPSSTSLPANGSDVEGDRPGELLGRREHDRGAVVGQLGGPVDDLADLLVELVDAGQSGAGHGLVGAGDEADEPGLVVQRLEDRHRRHRRAVGVGDDALAGVGDGARVDLGDDERDVGVHAERRRVVDDRRAGGGEPRRQLPRRRGAGREQGDVEAGDGSAVAASSTVISPSPHGRVVPAERAEAKKRISSTGKPRSASRRRITPPT